MKLSYENSNYTRTRSTLAMMESEIIGKAWGEDQKFASPRHLSAPQAILTSSSQGLHYTTVQIPVTQTAMVVETALPVNQPSVSEVEISQKATTQADQDSQLTNRCYIERELDSARQRQFFRHCLIERQSKQMVLHP